MIKKLLRALIITGIIAFVVFVAGLSAVYIKYRSITVQNIPVKYVKTDIQPWDEVSLGNPVKVTIILKAPWNKYPLDVNVNPAKGSQLYEAPKIIKEKRLWGYTLWKICFSLQAFSTGLIPEGSLKVDSCLCNKHDVETLHLKTPEFKSLEIRNPPQTLHIAEKVLDKKITTQSKITYFLVILIVLLLLLILFLVFKRKKNNLKPITSWEKAILTLNKLKSDYHSGSVNTLRCISLLTDIVRNYLEERFRIHAPKQTTYEFLSNMETPNSPLNNKDRNFLREFMLSADMIKFAKCEANVDMIENSINRAVQLVTESIPSQEETVCSREAHRTV